ncbi:MAG: PQQ-binding-like beta-propeller repeat protein [Acidimicrobiales bacterium]
MLTRADAGTHHNNSEARATLGGRGEPGGTRTNRRGQRAGHHRPGAAGRPQQRCRSCGCACHRGAARRRLDGVGGGDRSVARSDGRPRTAARTDDDDRRLAPLGQRHHSADATIRTPPTDLRSSRHRRRPTPGGVRRPRIDWPDVALADDVVLVIGEAGIIALDRTTLAHRWYLPCDRARLPGGSARAAGTAALVQCDGTGSLRGIDLATGDAIWTEQAYFSYDGLRASNDVYAWISDNKVIVADTSTGDRLWTGPVSALRGKRPIGVDDERVYLSAGGKLGAYNATNGTPVWEVDLPSVEARSDGGELFAIAGDELIGLDAATGGEVWRTSLLDDRPVEGEILAITPQSVVVEGAPGQIVVVDRSSGAVRWRERGAELVAAGAGSVAMFVANRDDDGDEEDVVEISVYDELTGAPVQTLPAWNMAIDGDEAAWLELDDNADIDSAVTVHVAPLRP